MQRTLNWSGLALPAWAVVVWLWMLGAKLDGSAITWYSVFGVLCTAPLAPVVDGLGMLLCICQREARRGDGASAFKFVKCGGLWRSLVAAHGTEMRRMWSAVHCGLVLLLLTAQPLLFAAKLAGDVTSPWGAVCAPLWVLHLMSCCALVPEAQPAGQQVQRSIAFSAAVCSVTLTASALVVARADGMVVYSLGLALTPVWVCLTGTGTVALMLAARAAGRMARTIPRRAARVTMIVASIVLSVLLFALVALTPISVAMKVDNGATDDGSTTWFSVLLPNIAVMSGVACVATVNARRCTCGRPQDYNIPGQFTYSSRAQSGPWHRVNAVVTRRG